MIADDCKVGENAQVVRSVLLNGARVEANAVVIDSAVMGHIGSFAEVTSCLVGIDGDVRSGAVLRDAKVPDPN
jgi:ADP-glucose pyrophosphorylase